MCSLHSAARTVATDEAQHKNKRKRVELNDTTEWLVDDEKTNIHERTKNQCLNLLNQRLSLGIIHTASRLPHANVLEHMGIVHCTEAT